MRFSRAITGGLVFGLAQASSLDGKLIRDDVCADDALHECFTRSLVQASSYCTASVITAAATITEVATVTPTVTITEQATETVTERTGREVKRARRRKRGSCGKVPLACLRNLGTFQPLQLSSACSCIGVTAVTSTEFATATATEAATEIITQVTTVTTLEEILSTTAPEPETSTVIPESVTSAPSEATSSTSEAPASTSSAIPPPPPPPVVTNGDFETQTLEGWSVISRTNTGETLSAIPYGGGGNYVMEIATSYFARSAASAVSVGQTIACEAGKRYRISLLLSVVSNYTNGNPWSVIYGGTTLMSGAGSSLAWTQQSFVVTCGVTGASNSLQIRLQSNTNRAARLMVDNISATLVV
ncbi:hypothetical protein QBC44DRAFT_352735 [Cladorrhinum sp. PSN332]|nr:hypothetical protein QBC44DRAFT_352735 [Cladorrhinum sp. PSN332]